MESSSLNHYLKKRKLLATKISPLNQYVSTWSRDNPNTCEDCSQAPRGDISTSTENSEELMNVESENSNLVMANYIIVKKILSNFLCWQDLKLTSLVCKMWSDVVRNLFKNCLKPNEFCFYSNGAEFVLENKAFKVEPMLVLAFANPKSQRTSYLCELFPDSSCHGKSCREKHKMLDYIYATLCYPSNSLVGVSCSRVVYYPPVARDKYAELALFNTNTATKESFIGGVCLPRIPGVHLHELSSPNISSNADAQFEIVHKIVGIMKTEIIKCVIVLAGNRFPRLEEYLLGIIELIWESQKEISPLALGGCRIQCSFNDNYHLSSGRDGRKITFLIFTVDKEPESPVEFDAFSAVFLADKDVEPKMMELATLPRREHSAAIKLSCVGRTDFDQLESELFSSHFPSTSLVGCYGQQEMGADCYPQLVPRKTEPPSKKTKSVSEYQNEIFFSYSTVIVVLTWGKLLPSNQSDLKT